MSLHEYLLQLLIEAVAVQVVIALQCWVHALFGALGIRLWRTGPVCACTP